MPARSLWLVAVAALVWRAWLAKAMPLTGDEALFYWWSRFLDYGYYDHPPMVAWWIAASRALMGDAAWAVRATAVALPLGVGWAMWWGWSPIDRRRAAWAVLLYWLAPLNWLNALVVTDTPLILWAAWSAAAMVRAERATEARGDAGQGAWALYALSGVFMGLAFLSKYFAVLLGLAHVAYFAVWGRGRWRGLALMVVFALPAVAVNVLWNLNHCWANIMFNLFNRNEGAQASWGNVLTFVGMMAYLLGPVLLYAGFRQRRALLSAARSQPLTVCMALVPLLCFALMSAQKVIGLHWVLGFYPFVHVWLVWALPAEALPALRRGLAVWLGLHLLLCVGVAVTELKQWQSLRYYHRVVEAVRAPQMVAQVQAQGVVLASNGYSSAAIFGHAAGVHVPVLGMGSVHARQDDLTVDYAQFDGRTVRVMATRPLDPADYEAYFDSVRLLTFQQDGATFYAVEGVGFRHEAYRAQVTAQVNRLYYRFPAWLPVWGCSFCQRYCGADRCPEGGR